MEWLCIYIPSINKSSNNEENGHITPSFINYHTSTFVSWGSSSLLVNNPLEESQTNYINRMYSSYCIIWYVVVTMTPSKDNGQQSFILHRFTILSNPHILRNQFYVTQTTKEIPLFSNTHALPFWLSSSFWRQQQQYSTNPDEIEFSACCRIEGRIGICMNRDFRLKLIEEVWEIAVYPIRS